jgi:sec-independent protein translocase protein TatA
MFGFGMPEMIIILVIVLVVFGAGKLPEIGSAMGKSIRNFKRATDDKDEIEIKPSSGKEGKQEAKDDIDLKAGKEGDSKKEG